MQRFKDHKINTLNNPENNYFKSHFIEFFQISVSIEEVILIFERELLTNLLIKTGVMLINSNNSIALECIQMSIEQINTQHLIIIKVIKMFIGIILCQLYQAKYKQTRRSSKII